MGLTEEQIESVIHAHSESVDALKGFEADARRLQEVKRELDEARGEQESYRERYERERDTLRRVREEAQAKETAAQKAALYRAALKDAGVEERRHDAILRATDLNAIAVSEGRLADEDAVREGIVREWGDFIPAVRTTGTRVENPPVSGGSTLTREQILTIRDPAKRQRAIAENIEQFRKG